MSRRRAALLAASFALGGLFIAALIKVGKINLYATFEHLEHVNRAAFAGLVALTAVHIYLSSLKWRKIDAALRRSSDSAPSQVTAFSLTSIGVVLGQMLPVQIAMSTARTVGTYFYGSPLKRGTGGTLYEQGFDVLIFGFLSIASGITWILHGGAGTYIVSAAVMAVAGVAAVGPSIGMLRGAAFAMASKAGVRRGILSRLPDLQQSEFLDARLARQLMMLSAARFVVLVLMAGASAGAVGAHIPLWHLAAAIPFATLAAVFAMIPGGLGVNELGYAFTLSVFGTPFAVGAQWALENRILVVASCLVIAGCGSVLLGLERVAARRMGGSSGASRDGNEISRRKRSAHVDADSL